jgi:hypothetical protein
VSRPVDNLPGFSFDGKAFLAVVLNKWLSNVAKQNGLDPSRVSYHFLRIGVASALAVANVPDYLIQKMGRWNSLAFV